MIVTVATLGDVAVAYAETSSGSGVLIGTKGEILTNAHVVEACQIITVKLASGNSQTAVLVARDERNDLAVVRLTGADNPATSVAVFREGQPVRAGDAVVALGYPLSGLLATDATLSVGNVSGLSGIADDSRYLQISAPVQPGNSGGPLLDASGHLVGIVTAKLNALRVARFTGDISENVNFALKAEVARTFLDSKHIGYQTARSDRQLSPADVGDVARPSTVNIECERGISQAAAASAVPGASVSNRAAPIKEDVDSCLWQSADVIERCSAVIQRDHPAWAFNSRCKAYYRKGDYDRAIADCTEAIRLDLRRTSLVHPAAALTFTTRGWAYAAKGEYDRAIADFSEAVRLSPKVAATVADRGQVYQRKGDYDHAIADYDRAIMLDPKLRPAYIVRASAYQAKGDYDHAIADYDLAITLNPSLALAFQKRGFAYFQKRDYDHAIADYDEAIRLDPKLAGAYYDHGVASVYAGSLPKALGDFKRSVEINPRYPYTAIWLDIVTKRSNLPSILAQAASQIDMTKWPAPVIRFYLGELTSVALHAAADDPDAVIRKNQVCEANFYDGEILLQQGAKNEAIRLFQLAAEDCPKDFVEWAAANAELKVLAQGH